jgi:hypothetical protein
VAMNVFLLFLLEPVIMSPRIHKNRFKNRFCARDLNRFKIDSPS